MAIPIGSRMTPTWRKKMRENRSKAKAVNAGDNTQPSPAADPLSGITKRQMVPETSQQIGPSAGEVPASKMTSFGKIEPVIKDIDPEQETVESRLNRLTSAESPYIRQARQGAVREANTRGLINSTMAAGAGQEAAIQAALPIAQQDAELYSRQRELSQNTMNEFLKNEQSAELNKELEAFGNTLAMEKEAFSSELTKDREAFASGLTKDREAFISKIKTNAELVLNDAKFSDEIKLQYVATINNIVRDSQQQIVEVGLSDRSAAQQAEAIKILEANRDASIKVYEDLLQQSTDWKWTSTFTPEVTNSAEANNYWNTPGGIKPTSEPDVGTVIDDKIYRGSGIWDNYQNNQNNSYY